MIICYDCVHDIELKQPVNYILGAWTVSKWYDNCYRNENFIEIVVQMKFERDFSNNMKSEFQ